MAHCEDYGTKCELYFMDLQLFQADA